MSLEVLGSQHIGRFEHSPHPVIATMLERSASGYVSQQYDDGEVLDFVVEGGGFSGVVPGGGLLVCEQTDLVRTFDRGKGTSAGAFGVSSTASGQAADALMNYVDLLEKPFVRPARLLAGRAAANYNYLINDLVLDKRPLDLAKLARGPKVGAVAVNLLTSQAELLQDFEDTADMLLAIRASCSIPILAGPPVDYKGTPMSDGGLLAAVPFKQALQDRATRVLVLRSCGEDTRKEPESRVQMEIVRRHRWGGAVLTELVENRARIYNEDAEILQADDHPNVLQVALPGNQRPVPRLAQSVEQVKHGIQLGADAMGKVLGTPKIHVAWANDRPIMLTDPHASY